MENKLTDLKKYDLENTNVIPPVDEGIERPLWSVMIPTFNPKKFIFESLESVLSQFPGREKMQIEIVDDCSDKVDIPKLIGDLGKGIISYYRLPKNVGHSFNFTEALRRSKGKYIHILHDDDLVKPGFYKKFEEIFETFPEAGAAYCRQEYIDDEGNFLFYSEPDREDTGILEDGLIKLAERQRIQYCAMAVKRSTYEKTGGFIRKNIGCEDWEMWVRIASMFKIAYEPEVFATYRIHKTSMTLNDMRTGQDMRFLREAVDIFNKYLPEEKRKGVKLFTRKYYAGYSFKNAMMLLNEQNDEKGAAEQISETIMLDSGHVYKNIDTLKNFKTPIKNAGISVIVFTKNDKDKIIYTLRSLIRQKVPAYIPFEIIIADSGSADGTADIAERFLNLYSEAVKFKILEYGPDNNFDTLRKTVEESDYNFLVFCFPGNKLDEYYLKNASENIMKESDTGILGGYSEFDTNMTLPSWVNDVSKSCYQTGEQFEYNSDITWSRGYVWKDGMVLRKEAWIELLKSNFSFKSAINEEGISLSVKELCYALRLKEWRINYSVDLKLKKYFGENEFSWERLREISHEKGKESVLLNAYNIRGNKTVDNFSLIKSGITGRRLFRTSGRKLRKFSQKKLRNYASQNLNDREILSIEFQFGRLKTLLQSIASYNKKIRTLKRYFRKKDFRYLKHVTGKPYFRFPQYKNPFDKRGVSVIVNYCHTGDGFLMKCAEKITGQVLPNGFKWEVIFNGPEISGADREKLKSLWKKSRCDAKLILQKEKNLKPFSQKKSGLTKSSYECIIFLNEYNFINSDYVRIAYKILKEKKHIGLLGGSAEMESGVRPPKWFSRHKELFGIDIKYPNYGNLTYTGHTLWDQGLIVRRAAIQKVLKKDFYLNTVDIVDSRNMNYEGKVLSNLIKSSGWEVFYEPRLKLKKFISVNQFKWKTLREIHHILGTEHARQEIDLLFEKPYKMNTEKREVNWIFKANNVIGEITRYPLRKIFSSKNKYKYDTDILEIEELQGRLGEIFRNRDKYNKLKEYKTRFENNGKSVIQISKNSTSVADIGNYGVSVIICCYNSSKVIEKTLKSIINQKVSDIIPWEVIIVDNASTDNTSEIIKQYWQNHNCLAPLKIVKEKIPGLSTARKTGFENARYEFMILCDDDNRLEENFISRVFDVMSRDKMIGVLGGQSTAEFESLPKNWFYDWQNSFAIGKQSETSGNITGLRGYVWGAAMTVRKNAWNYLLKSGFKSRLSDRKGMTLTAGGDTEICYALRNQGWKIWYDSGLKFTHYITKERINWKYLRKLFRGFGEASAGLDNYLRFYSNLRGIKKTSQIPGNVRLELRKTISVLRKTRYEKLLNINRRREGDTDIPMLEYCIGRVESILKSRRTYNRGIHLLKKTAKKRDLKILKTSLRKAGLKFPSYNIQKKYNGVSVIVCTFNGEDRLPDTMRHIALQKVNPEILWEVILVDNASTDNTKGAVINEWQKHKCSAKLRIVDEYTQGLSAARQKGFEVSRYEYVVLCDDDNWLDENFVQTAFEIMRSNEKIGVLGGPNKALCETKPPDWFKYFQKGYAAGDQGDIHTGKITEGNITWKRGFVWGAGMILRKTALKELYKSGFTSIMSDRKGYHLSSGGDSELCYALVLSGWQVWYDIRLKLIHCMPSGRLVWDYLIRLFAGFGITSVGLDHYEKTIKLGRSDFTEAEILEQDWKYEFRKTLKDVRKYGIRKLLSLRHRQENNTRVPMMEYYIARLSELWRVRKEYDKQFEKIRNARWKKNNKELKSEFRNFIEKENDYRYGWPWISLNGKVSDASYSEDDFPKISILTPSFNSANVIEKAILSVLNQGYPNFEHIICDGGSKDGTVEILKKYPHLKWISEPDKGQCDAMNKAFSMSNGDIISYLNADDYYQKGAFNKIIDAFRKNPDSGIVVGNLFFEYDYYTFMRKPESEYRKIMLPFKYIFPINPVSYFYKRIVQIDAGAFPIDNHYTMDYWFLLKAYQNFKVTKIEDFLGTFWMNGLNKTSAADNRKNTHYRVVEHCWNHDRGNLLFYLYNYYKHYYYDVKPYNLSRIGYKLKKNLRRVYSVITFRKNKYYNEKLFQKARSDFYLNKRFRSSVILLGSYLIYPKAIKKKSRAVLLAYSVLGIKFTEKLKWFYYFLTTPPGLPLANKLHYYGTGFKKDRKFAKGYSLLFLTFLISPGFAMKQSAKSHSGRKHKGILFYINPLNWLKVIYGFFKNKRYKSISNNLYYKAGEHYLHKRNIRSVYCLISGLVIYPPSAFKKSRLNLLLYSSLGNEYAEKLKFMHHLYKDNPEYSFAHKLDYYGNELRKEGRYIKGNSILLFAYMLNPKYITKRKKIKKSNIVYASDYKLPKRRAPFTPASVLKNTGQIVSKIKNTDLDLGTKIKNTAEISKYKIVQIYHYFRYRKFKAKSKVLYELAQKSYAENKRYETIRYIIPSFLLYPVSIFKRNKVGMFVNSLLGNSAMKRAGKKTSKVDN